MSASLSAQSKAQSLRYFDTSYYLNSNPDVLAAVVASRTTAFDHFANFGAKEGRSPNALFNASSYIANNPDIAFAVGAGRIHSGWDHFVNVGIVEGRSNGTFTGTFNSAAYLAANADVAAAISSTSFRSAYEHFLLFGRAEGRAATNTAGDSITSLPGQTFTLTTGTDNFIGSAGNDTYTASTVYDSNEAVTATSTYTVADQLSGGAGTDTMNLVISGAQNAAVVIPSGSITGVETLNVRNTVAQSAELDASTIAGLTTFAADRSVGATAVVHLASGASAGMIGDGTVANGAFAAGYVAAATAGILNISGGTTAGAVTLSGPGLTSQTVNSTGATNIIGALALAATDTSLTVNATTNLTTDAVSNTTAAALTTVTVTGAGAVSFGSTALESKVTKIDASANTGGLTVALGSAVTQAVTGSSGNDVITSGAILTTGSVNAGAGTDTLVVSAVAQVNTVSLAAKYTNFETLRVNGTIDASLIAGITAIQLTDATNSITNMTATQAAAVTARASIGATTLTLATATGTSDVLNMTMGLGTTTAVASNAGILTTTGFETMNLRAVAGPTAAAGTDTTSTITGAIVNTSLTAINLTGTAFSLTDIATTKAVTIDGSALTGNKATTVLGLTVAGSATAGSTIIGSAFGDRFTIAAEGSTYNGGAGADIITTTAAILNPDGTTDVIIAGGSGSDTLTLTGALTLTDVHFTNVTGMEKLATAVTTAVSYTGFGAAVKAAFADGLTITSGTLADGATYTVAAGLYDKAVTLTLVSAGIGDTTADNIAITTGVGADTITVTAADFVGAVGAAGAIAVTTGAGNDTISVTTGIVLAVTGTSAVTINAGTGADVITSVGVNAAAGAGVLTPTYVIAAGDSLVSAFDSITGFDMANGTLSSSTLDFASVSITAYTATAATGFTGAELTVAVATGTGLVTFAGTSAAGATLAQKIAAVQSVVITTAGDSALFTHAASSGVVSSYVFNNNATADSVVELVGITATALGTTTVNTAGLIFIA